MATAKKKTAPKPKQDHTAILNRLLDLYDQGQIDLNCGDAEQAFADIHRALGLKKRYPCAADNTMYVRFVLDLDYVEVEPEYDPEDCETYQVIIKDKKGRILGQGSPNIVELI